jgi:hypothetical protein
VKVLQDLTAVLKVSAAKKETRKITITASPSIEEFREQRRRKRKPTGDAYKRAKKPMESTRELKMMSKSKVPTLNTFVPMCPIEMEADYDDQTYDTTECQQFQAPSSQAGRPPLFTLTSQVNLIKLQRQLKGLLKGIFQFGFHVFQCLGREERE